MDWYDKPIFHGLLHSALPDLEALYRVGKIPPIEWNRFSGWDDPLGLPTSAWYDAVAASVHAPRNIVLVDHEQWPYDTQTERQATAAKYVTLYQELKVRQPGWRIGWYGDPIRRDFWNAIKGPGAVEYKGWQAKNNDLGAIMAPFTDVFMPTLYAFYTRDTSPDAIGLITTYLIENINEAKRIRRIYGRLESPIYPYISPQRQDVAMDLDADVWSTIVNTVMDQADGCVLWSGPLPWDEQALWWVTIKARLTDKRRTQ